MRKKLGLRRYAGLTGGHRRYVGLTTVMAVAALVFVPLALAGAINTTTDSGQTVGTATTGVCVNGPDPSVNCNIYSQKEDVFLSGSPTAASLDTGTYYFAVLDPGGQRDPNPAAPKVLSSDATLQREFTITDGATGAISYSGTHTFDSTNNKLSVFPYNDTSNPGGVYILAVCKISSDQGAYTSSVSVKPSDCKYDAFKVRSGGTTPPAASLDVTKDAAPAYTVTYGWTIDKSVDACEITTTNTSGCSITGTTKTLNYTVAVTKDAGTASAWVVTGNIYLLNGGSLAATSVSLADVVKQLDTSTTPATVGATDSNASCSIDSGAPDYSTVASGASIAVPYTCTYSDAPQAASERNIATATYNDGVNSGQTASGFADFLWADATITKVHDSVTVSDLLTSTNPATLPSGFVVGSPVGDSVSGPISASTTFHYSRTLTVPHNCLTINNTASFADGTYTGSDSVSAKVCRTPPATGALTMGFWQNKNGQGIVLNYSGTNCQALATWLKGFHPFSDLTATTCGTSPSLTGKSTTAPSGVVGYVYTVIKAATCTSTSKTCNSMLKAQMLATALDVYFSDSIANGYGGNRINAPHPIGGITIDLQNICKMIDGTGGTATCSGTYEDVSSAFGGATSMTVLNMLLYQNTSDPAVDAGANWYGQVKATQVLAKDAFDAINNQVAFSL
jgi:hypothetical protein